MDFLKTLEKDQNICYIWTIKLSDLLHQQLHLQTLSFHPVSLQSQNVFNKFCLHCVMNASQTVRQEVEELSNFHEFDQFLGFCCSSSPHITWNTGATVGSLQMGPFALCTIRILTSHSIEGFDWMSYDIKYDVGDDIITSRRQYHVFHQVEPTSPWPVVLHTSACFPWKRRSDYHLQFVSYHWL